MKNKDFSFYLSRWFQEYLPFQEGCSTNTIKSYRDAFCMLLGYLQEYKDTMPNKVTFSKISRQIIEDFILWIETEKKSSVPTRNSRLAAIRSFFHYLQREEPQYLELCNGILSIPSKKVPKKDVYYLSLEELKILLSSVSTISKEGKRELAVLSLLYDSGARAQELIDLTVPNVRTDKPYTVRLTGKGNKTRIVPIMPQTVNIILSYIKAYSNELQKGYPHSLFFNRQGNKLSNEGLSYIIDKYVAIAQRKRPDLFSGKVTPHTFRHSKAMHLVEGNVNLIYIRDFLGHESVVTSEIYARANPEVKRKAIEKASTDIVPANIYNKEQKQDLLHWLRENI